MTTTSYSKMSSEEIAVAVGLPMNVAQPTLVAYRSTGIGIFGATMRWIGMPLEKIALYMNSSQVSGSNPFQQAIRLTFKDGYMAPYRVVGTASLTSWFLAYSVMGVAFQFVDQTLSRIMNVRPVYYGKELMEPPAAPTDEDTATSSLEYKAKICGKTFMAPVLSSCMESTVSNRAEVQRYFGPEKFAQLEQALQANPLKRFVGPAFGSNAMRNIIMCNTSFVLTPVTYKLYFPQEHKNKSTLFWYGLGLNVFAGNVAAITQQAMWGRSLDYLVQNGKIQYSQVVRQGLSTEGWKAFFTGPKWFSRVLMNAPAQGTLPWFYNEVLPLAEQPLLAGVKSLVYDPLLAPKPEVVIPTATPVLLHNKKHHHHIMPTVTIRRHQTHTRHHHHHPQEQQQIAATSPR